MRYVLANKSLAIGAGFRVITHRHNDDIMLLNENEVRNCPSLEGSLEDRVGSLKGVLLTQALTFQKINKKGKYKL